MEVIEGSINQDTNFNDSVLISMSRNVIVMIIDSDSRLVRDEK